jgi:hypothetical protein
MAKATAHRGSVTWPGAKTQAGSGRRERRHGSKQRGGPSRPFVISTQLLAYFLTSPGAGVGFGAPELSFSAGILCEPAAPVVDGGDGFAFEPPVEPLGFRSTAPLLPPACSSICFVVPCALATAIPVIRAAPATRVMRVMRVFILVPHLRLARQADSRPATKPQGQVAPRSHCSRCHTDLIVVARRSAGLFKEMLQLLTTAA